MYGYDENYAYLVDTLQQGKEVKTTLENLKLARNEKGPMSSRNLSYTIQKLEKLPDLKTVIPNAITRNAKDYLSPPITNIGYRGIVKTSKEIKKWFQRSTNISRDFKTTAMLMEKAGTGGALFRNLYRDFLKESFDLLQLKQLEEGYTMFYKIAQLWTKISTLFDKTGETENMEFINEASEILIDLSEKEKKTMELLYSIK